MIHFEGSVNADWIIVTSNDFFQSRDSFLLPRQSWQGFTSWISHTETGGGKFLLNDNIISTSYLVLKALTFEISIQDHHLLLTQTKCLNITLENVNHPLIDSNIVEKLICKLADKSLQIWWKCFVVIWCNWGSVTYFTKCNRICCVEHNLWL